MHKNTETTLEMKYLLIRNRRNLKMQLDMVTHPCILYRQYINMIKTRVRNSVYYMRHEIE